MYVRPLAAVSIKTVVRVRRKRCSLSPSSDFRPDDSSSVASLPQHGNSNISQMWTKRYKEFEGCWSSALFVITNTPTSPLASSGVRKGTSGQGQDRHSRLPRRVRVPLRVERLSKCLLYHLRTAQLVWTLQGTRADPRKGHQGRGLDIW